MKPFEFVVSLGFFTFLTFPLQFLLFLRFRLFLYFTFMFNYRTIVVLKAVNVPQTLTINM